VGGISVTELNILEREFLSAIDWRLTCTSELLQEYYVNLVRTNSKGQFIVTGPQSPTSPTSDGDVEMGSGLSRPPSPVETSELPLRHRPRRSIHETSTILIDPAPISQDSTRRPTVEQNMAFAALQQSGIR